MKNNKKLLILLIVFILLLVGAGVLYSHLSDQFSPSLAGQETTAATDSATGADTSKAPNFTVTDTDGNPVELYDFLGKPIILNFWASWCGPCRSEMAEIQAAYETYGDEIHFLIVNLTDGARETVESAANYITKAGYTFPVYFDTSLNAAVAYSAYSIPITFFIDAEGRGVARYSGAMSADVLQQGIDLMLSE